MLAYGGWYREDYCKRAEELGIDKSVLSMRTWDERFDVVINGEKWLWAGDKIGELEEGWKWICRRRACDGNQEIKESMDLGDLYAMNGFVIFEFRNKMDHTLLMLAGKLVSPLI